MNIKNFAFAAGAVVVGIWVADILGNFGLDPASMIAPSAPTPGA